MLRLCDPEESEDSSSSAPPTKVRNSDVKQKRPNLFARLPHLVPMFRSLTLGGRPVFDEFGNVITTRNGRKVDTTPNELPEEEPVERTDVTPVDARALQTSQVDQEPDPRTPPVLGPAKRRAAG